MNNSWAYLFLLATVALGIYLLFKILKARYYKVHPLAISELIFQFTSLTETVVVPILTLPNIASDLKLNYTKTLKHFAIQGFCPAVLSFRWSAMIDKVSLLETDIPGSVSVLPWQA